MVRKFMKTCNEADRVDEEGRKGPVRLENERENEMARNCKRIWRERNSAVRGYPTW